MKPWPHQERTIANVNAAWSAGARSVLVVLPTGGGKTFIGQCMLGTGRALWVAHQRDIVLQTAKRLRAALGSGNVGIVMPGEYETQSARVQVGTIQTFLARDRFPDADRVVLDEAHHYVAEDWRELTERYRGIPSLGLTATPERGDGKPLGDIFDNLVVGAHYSELLSGGFLVPARVLQPPRDLGNDLAQDPVDAWVKHSEGSQAFVFTLRVADAYAASEKFRGLGVLAQTIEAETAPREREEHLGAFRVGKVRAICNVNTMTEGVDVPEARTAVLARSFGHVGGYLQAVGRVLRFAKDKPDAIVVDLCGSTIRHGLPTQDRVYSLTGRAISGGEFHGGGGGQAPAQEIVGLDLRMAAPGAWKPSVATVASVTPIDEGERRTEYRRLLGIARQHRMRDGFAAAKYREKYGEEPRREWA